MATKDRSKRRGELKPGQKCALCGHACESWQECVALQRALPKLSPADWVEIYDTGKPYAPEMVAAREADFARRFPFMTHGEIVTASLLEAASHVSAKAGGSAGSGRFSKHIADCRLRARKRGVIVDKHDCIVTKDPDQSNEDFY